MILQIAVPGIFDQALHYLPHTQDDHFQIGQRLWVPLRNKTVCGIVVDTSEQITYDQPLKSSKAIIDPVPQLTASFIRLIQWIANYYHYPLYQVFKMALPKPFLQGKSIQPMLETYYSISDGVTDYDAGQVPKQATKQHQLLKFLKARQLEGHQAPLSKKQLLNVVGHAVIQKAIQKNWLIPTQQSQQPTENTHSQSAGFQLTQQQQAVIEALSTAIKPKFSVHLLYGVTGSGKTQVYIQLIQQAIDQGNQVLVLVPEINLTPQTSQKIQQQFQVPTTTLHSGLTQTTYHQRWQWIKDHQVSIVIATRSGIFSSFKQLGLIIVDEEHEAAYKQQSHLRYHARDVAVMYGKILNIPVILGTATPSSESYYNVLNHKYHIHYLSQRASQMPMPAVELIDLTDQVIQSGISQLLLRQIKATLADHQQVLLFINRRGYAPVLMCHHCGWYAYCQRCEKALTLHSEPNQHLSCHFCHQIHAIYVNCPVCQSNDLFSTGIATEQVQTHLQHLFPNHNIIRLDKSSISNHQDLENALETIHNGWADIIIGTQMITKGHHFKSVTLVGILDVDGGLFSLDYRALEKTAQQIIQVAGRSGREQKTGRVYLQTHQPDHPMLQSLLREGYEAFLQQCLQQRQQHQWPPYRQQAIIRIEAHQSMTAEKTLKQIQDLLRQHHCQIDLLGPIPALHAKQAGFYRHILILSATSRSALHQSVSISIDYLQKSKQSTRWIVDMDPIDLH